MTPAQSSRALNREVTTAKVSTVKNTIQQDQIRDQKTEFLTSFHWRAWQSSSTRRQREQGKRQVQNKHKYPSEGTNQIKSLWHFKLTDGWESASKSESNLLLEGESASVRKNPYFFFIQEKIRYFYLFLSHIDLDMEAKNKIKCLFCRLRAVTYLSGPVSAWKETFSYKSSMDSAHRVLLPMLSDGQTCPPKSQGKPHHRHGLSLPSLQALNELRLQITQDLTPRTRHWCHT